MRNFGRNTIDILYLVLFGVIAYLLYKTGIFKKLTDESKDNLLTIDKDIDKNKLTFPVSQYGLFADSLEAAMFDCGTDEESVYAIFKKLKNDSDFYQLVKSFGRRPYTGDCYPNLLQAWTEGDTLQAWLIKDLEVEERAYVNVILANRNIKARI